MTRKELSEMISDLESIRDFELNKPIEEMDCDLIDYCVEQLRLLYAAGADAQSDKADALATEDTAEETEPKEKAENKGKKQIKSRKILMLAACVALLAVFMSIYAVSDYNIMAGHIVDKYGSYEDVPFGKVFEFDNKSEYRNEAGGSYKSVEEAEEKENTDLLNPKYVPGDLNLNEVFFSYDVDGLVVVSYSYEQKEDAEEYFSLYAEKRIISQQEKEITTYEKSINGFKCCFETSEETRDVQCMFEYRDFTYKICYSNATEIEKVIENMER